MDMTDNLTKEIEKLFEHTNVTEVNGKARAKDYTYTYKIKRKSLSTSQSEGTELPFKVPSANATDEPCPHKRMVFDDSVNNKKCDDCGEYIID